MRIYRIFGEKKHIIAREMFERRAQQLKTKKTLKRKKDYFFVFWKMKKSKKRGNAVFGDHSAINY